MPWVLFVSILLNAVAVVFAVRMMRLTGRPVGWLLLSAAFVFMLVHSVTEVIARGDAGAFMALHRRLEIFELFVSAAVVFGMAKIRRSFIERELARRQVALAKRQWDETFDAIASPIFLHDGEFRIVRANRAYFSAAGKTPRETLGKPYWEIFPRGDGPLPVCRQALDTRSYGASEITVDGEVFEARAYVVNDNGRYAYSIHVMENVTEKRRQEEELREREDHYRTLFEKSLSPIMVTDADGIFVDANQAALEFLEAERRAVIGKSVFDFSPPQDKPGVEVAHRPLWKHGGVIETSYWVNGRIKVMNLSITPAVRHGRAIMYGIGIDITSRKMYEEALAHQAQYDALTDLPNRSLLNDRLHQAILFAKQTDRMVGVLFMDVDQFKVVNETLGHEVGDQLLVALATRLKGCIRERDTLSRYGGDEFVVVVPGLERVDELFSLAEQIMRVASEPAQIDSQYLHLTLSIGVSIYPRDGDAPTLLLRNADAALYEAKATGGNDVSFFTRELNRQVRERFRLRQDLRTALERNQLNVVFQPQVDMRTGKLQALEALVRWSHPQFGEIPPERFIAIAEETGLIIPLGRWVLSEAFRHAKLWQELGLPPVCIAVNLSPKQLERADGVASIARTLTEAHFDGRFLELEVTENAVMRDPERMIERLKELKTLGLSLALDDFGTGYSNLAYLQRYPFDKLKIDRSFVQDMFSDPGVNSLVLTIIAMAQKLHLRNVAEGVERQEQAEFLRDHGCEDVQGFYYSPPLSPSAAEQLLREGRPLGGHEVRH